jgi:hypothetical protein
MPNYSCNECGAPIDCESGLPDIVSPWVVDRVRAFLRDLQIDNVPLSVCLQFEVEELSRLFGTPQCQRSGRPRKS